MVTILHRMSAAGNAFYLSLDLDAKVGPSLARLLARSSDGLILGFTDPNSMRMFNPDGSEAMCGNGLRCLARLMSEVGQFEDGGQILTMDGPKTVKIRGDFVEAEMGHARSIEKIGCSPEEILEIQVGKETFSGHAVFVGNPHWVIPSDESLQKRVCELGPLLQVHPKFPSGVNAEFAIPEGDGFRVRVWERGVGETLSCGTGALAVAAAGPGGIAPGEKRRIRYPGGELIVRSDSSGLLLLGGEIRYDGLYEWRKNEGLVSLQEEKA